MGRRGLKPAALILIEARDLNETSPGDPTVAQRIVRAKAKIREARIPYQVPSAAELPDRLEAELRVVYLVFNEGYSASAGAALTRLEPERRFLERRRDALG